MVTIATGFNNFIQWMNEDNIELSQIDHITRTQGYGYRDIQRKDILRIDNEGVHIITPKGNKNIVPFGKIVSYTLI